MQHSLATSMSTAALSAPLIWPWVPTADEDGPYSFAIPQ
jgi:hypothetical protein